MDDSRCGRPKPTIVLGSALLLLAGCAVPSGPREVSDRLVATTWGDVLPWTITFSADGSSAAYVTRKDGRTWVVSGNWKSAAFESAGGPRLSADGRVTAFVAAREGRTALYRMDSPLFEFTGEWAQKSDPLVSADGSVIAILVGNDKATALVRNGTIQKVYPVPMGYGELVGKGLDCFSTLKVGEKVCVVVNGTPGPLYDWISCPGLSEDGKTVAYMAGDSGGPVVVHGPRVVPMDPEVCLIFLSKDGSKLGSVVWDDPNKRSAVSVVVEGHVGPKMRIIGNPLFSPDGQHVTYLTFGPGDIECVAIDDRILDAGGEIAYYSTTFLGDGNTVGCGIRKGTELRWKTFKLQ